MVVHYRKYYSFTSSMLIQVLSVIEVCSTHYTVDIAGVCKHATTTTSSVLMFEFFLCTICVYCSCRVHSEAIAL
jgi:hypothetical protein